MIYLSMPSSRLLLPLLTFILAVRAQYSGLSQVYCSNQNTGLNSQPGYSDYQSDGLCKTQCEANYAFAVVQYKNCWCSNYAPANQVDVSQCSAQCPGYPTDKCGNVDQGLFGYIALGKAPLGTAGGSGSSSTKQQQQQQTSVQQPQSTSPTSASPTLTTPTSTPTPTTPTTTQQPATAYVSQTVIQTVTPDPTPTTVVSVSLVTLTPSTSTETSSSAAPPVIFGAVAPSSSPQPLTTNTPTPVTSTQVVTVSGAAVTRTVTSTPFVASPQDASPLPFTQKGLSGGAIAGIVIGTVLGTLAILLAFFLLWRRRSKTYPASEAGASSMKTSRSPKRNTSVLSKSGLLGSRGRDETAEKDYEEYNNAGTTSQRHSMLFGASGVSAEGVSPVSPLGPSNDGDSRRNSKPLVYDQRLNPSALFANHDANGSRISMQDNADYSRPLGVTNPDPRASFDSRVSRA